MEARRGRSSVLRRAVCATIMSTVARRRAWPSWKVSMFYRRIGSKESRGCFVMQLGTGVSLKDAWSLPPTPPLENEVSRKFSCCSRFCGDTTRRLFSARILRTDAAEVKRAIVALYCWGLWVGLQDSRFSDLEPRLRDLAASDLVDTDNIDFATPSGKLRVTVSWS